MRAWGTPSNSTAMPGRGHADGVAAAGAAAGDEDADADEEDAKARGERRAATEPVERRGREKD